MPLSDPISNDLEKLEIKLEEYKSQIEDGIDLLEKDLNDRELRSKQILMVELKQVVLKLNLLDKNITQDLKVEAFDLSRSINKVCQNVCEVKDQISGIESEVISEQTKACVNKIEDEANQLHTDEFVKCLDLGVSALL